MATQYTDPMTEALMQQFLTGQTAQTDALNAIASRPQKEFQETKPLEYADMLARRNQIGAERAMLNEALKQRETFGYGLANALASMPAQQGAGSWLGDFARGFGSAFNARANAAIDRAKQDYESAHADLATALAFDKAMGEKQTMDYKAVPYSRGKEEEERKQQVPVIDPREWDYMIQNFDKDRPTEADYRNMNEKTRSIENWRVRQGWGDQDETEARRVFNINKGRNFLPMAREALKGAGQITDFEDKKYTQWLNEIEDPVQMKDTAKKIVRDVATLNGWSEEQLKEGFRLLGLQSEQLDLLESSKKAFPEQVKNDGWQISVGGIKYRIKQ